MRYTATNVTTFVMLLFTLWVIYARFRSKPDVSWPLFYYLAVVAYHQYLPSRLNEYLIYVGTIAALMMRFEFLGGAFGMLIRIAEVICLSLLAYQFAALVVR